MRLLPILLFSVLLALSFPAAAQQGDPPSSATPPPLPSSEQEEATDAEEAESPPPPGARVRRTPRVSRGDAPMGSFSLIAHGEEASVLARSELVVGQTLHGLTQAVLVCLLASCSTTQQVAGALLLGGVAGGLGSFFLTGSGISGGMATAVNTGTAWGLAEGLLLLGTFAPSTGTGYAGLLAGTTLLGTAAGVTLGGLLHPTGGQVAMASSGGIWTAVLVGLFSTPFLSGLSSQAFFGMELLAANVGLAGFGFLASRLQYSRGRVFLIDVGGVLGALVGGAAYFLAGLPVSQSQWLGPIAGAGAVGGLVGAVLLTANIDAPPDAAVAELSMFPLLGPGGETGLAFGGRF